MARGFERPPLSAVIAMVIGLAVFAVCGGIWIAGRGHRAAEASAAATGNAILQEKASAQAAADEAAAKAKRDAASVHITFPTGRPLHLVFLGDSVTKGFYATDEKLTFAGRVTTALQRHGPVAETNLGIPGQTVTDGLHDKIPSGSDLVVMMFGNNDISKSTKAIFAHDYAQLLVKIRQGSPSAAIVCVTPWLSPEYSTHGTKASELIQIVKQTCSGKSNVTVADASRWFGTGGLNVVKGTPAFGGRLAADGGHPGDYGHKDIADEILNWIVVRP